MSPPVLVVFTHRRWCATVRRPRPLLMRLAAHWRIVVVEEPVHAAGPAGLVATAVAAPGPDGPHTVDVLVPHTPVAAPGFHDDQLATLAGLLAPWLDQRGLSADVVWLDTPMALPLATTLAAPCTVYDCVDDLPARPGAARQMRQRESALLQRAAVVLAGGPSLYESRRERHGNVHCMPPAVDAARFAPSALVPDGPAAQRAHALQGHLPSPRLGFFGVIDERVDLDLLAALADARPAWSFVMAGPVDTAAVGALPQRANLHLLGEQAEEDLPYLLAGWDLALLPWAVCAATRRASPEQVLPYMAGGRPVVSTPVRDVMALYGEAVEMGDGVGGFLAACETVLRESPAQRSRRAIEMLTTVSVYDWDRAAQGVQGLLLQALRDARVRRARGSLRLVNARA